MDSCDVAIVGGGIIGVAAAALLAEAGLSVRLLERAEIGAGASGRNSGAIQHPFDPHMAELHRETLALYRAPEMEGTDFKLAAESAGLLLLSDDLDEVKATASAIARHSPELEPTVLSATELHALEPGLAPDLAACRVATGYPVAPMAATKAFGERARRAGAKVELGVDARPVVSSGECRSLITADGRRIAADKVLIAAGPWTPSLVDGWSARPPIRAVWGVVVSVGLPDAPRAVLEELGIDRTPGRPPDELFSLVTAAGTTSVGSTFLETEPDAASRSGAIIERAARYVPALRLAARRGVRACARPVSLDGRPLIGALPDVKGLFVCAGHGAWGISTGPASAQRVVNEMLSGNSSGEAFSAARFL